MTLNANALTDLASVKEYVQYDYGSTEKDDLFTSLINACSQAIENYIGKVVKKQTFTDEEYNGKGSDKLFLKNYPVISLSGLKIDDESESLNDYKINKDTGAIYKTNGVFKEGFLNVKVSYEAGYSTVPSDIELACKQLVKFYYKADIEDFSNSFDQGTIIRPEKFPSQVKALLSPYVSVVV